MKVILRQNVDTLGKMGEVLTVKNGFARNYLIPRSIAYFATPKALKALEVEKKQFAKVQAKERASAEILAAKITEQQISIKMKVGEEGKLYGSVTTQMIAQELADRGFELDKRNILLDQPIKTLGVFDIKIKLHTDVIPNLKIWVINEE
jgi:large subunit ribosomal protein L9